MDWIHERRHPKRMARALIRLHPVMTVTFKDGFPTLFLPRATALAFMPQARETT